MTKDTFDTRAMRAKRLTLALAAAALGGLGVSAGALAQAQLPVVGHRDRSYSTDLVTVRAGGQVRFNNDDSVAHNVTVRDAGGRQVATFMLRPGEHNDFTFQVAGEHGITCIVHPRKRMTVRVI